MSTDTRTMTADELWRMPSDDQRYELICGELITMTPAGFRHGRIEVQTIINLGIFVKANKLGAVVSGDTGFVLSRNPDTVLCPDVGFVRQERIPDPVPEKFWEGAPDLAVEVLSPSDLASDVEEKVQKYLNAGTIEVLVVNPKAKQITVFRPSQIATVLRSGDVLENLASVPGFRCTVDEIFE